MQEMRFPSSNDSTIKAFAVLLINLNNPGFPDMDKISFNILLSFCVLLLVGKSTNQCLKVKAMKYLFF